MCLVFLFLGNWAILQMFSNIGAFFFSFETDKMFSCCRKIFLRTARVKTSNLNFNSTSPLKTQKFPKIVLVWVKDSSFHIFINNNNNNKNITLQRNITSLRIIHWTPHSYLKIIDIFIIISTFWSLHQIHSQWITWFSSVGKKHWRVLEKTKTFYNQKLSGLNQVALYIWLRR